ncbi:hypothetical protein PLANPX_5307 [Lacipirellula parvula]|uniref:Uncharacterized protein n=1 Tax=Lacipirellula parvula TaxID=2650471 RepID=A0A5K7XH31_9BACT|nr:hypothetical protein PLANPX_5307 [Lacipirellula parvula]
MASDPVPTIRCGKDSFVRHTQMNAGRVSRGEPAFNLILDVTLGDDEYVPGEITPPPADEAE